MSSSVDVEQPWTTALEALRDGERGAPEQLQVLLAPLAAAVLWKRCAAVVGDGLVQRAMETVYIKVVDKVLPLAGDAANPRNRSYVRRIVYSRFCDMRRKEHKNTHLCGNDRVELDESTLETALDCVDARQLCAAAERLDPKLTEAADLLAKAVAIRQDGAREAAAILEMDLEDPQFHRAWRLLWRRIGQLRRALLEQCTEPLAIAEARRVRKLLAWLGEKPLDLPPTAKNVEHDELEDAEINRALQLLDHYGVLRRIEKDGGPQGLSADLQRQALSDMIAIKREAGVTVPQLLGCAREDPEFVRRRNALYQTHSRVRTRIATKAAWLADRNLLDDEACAAIEGLLRYLGHRVRG